MAETQINRSLGHASNFLATKDKTLKLINTQNYQDWTKEELIDEIKKLRKRKKYGLVWEMEREPEKVVKLCKEKLPILIENKSNEIKMEESKFTNTLIEGDNYHALSVLNYTHNGKIDIIYIDPPYNTGNKEWKYNDQFVGSEDGYRHSKWLSFMSKRLLLAKNLLTEKGIFFISIDDNELYQLKLLCDEIFGEENFIVNFIRKKKSTSTNVKGAQVSSQADYILCYGRTNQAKLNQRIFEKKNRVYPHHDEIGCYRTAGIEKKNSGSYKRDTMQFEIMGMPPREGKRWQIGEETARILEKNNRFVIEDGSVKQKIYDFEDKDTFSAQPNFLDFEDKGTFSAQPNILENLGTTNTAQKQLDKILGKSGVFENPKPVELIEHLIKISEVNNEAVILDFFAGSGTTGDAVIELNMKDGGNRRFILCTNNENDICTEVCYPRIKKVMENYQEKSKSSCLLNSFSLKYYRTDFVDAAETDSNKKKLVDSSTEILCLKENCFNLEFVGKEFRIYSGNNNKLLSIIYDDEGIEECKAKLKDFNLNAVIYIFSLDDSNKEEDFIDIANIIEIKPIPASIMNVYRRLFK